MKTQQPSGDRRCNPQWHKWDRRCASLSSAALFKVEGDKNGTSCQQNLSKFFQEGGAEPTKHGEKKKLNGCQSETLNQFRLINYSLRTLINFTVINLLTERQMKIEVPFHEFHDKTTAHECQSNATSFSPSLLGNLKVLPPPVHDSPLHIFRLTESPRSKSSASAIVKG